MTASQPIKVAIITNLIPEYRRGFYERLLAEKSLDFTVFCQSYLPGMNIKPIQQELGCKFVEVPFWGLEKEKLVWQWLPILQLWQKFDVYIFYGNPRIFSNVIWATLSKLLGKAIIIWGQGHTAGANRRTEQLRLRWWRLFRYILVYSDAEAAYLKDNGFGQKVVIGINNGLDQDQIEKVAACWEAKQLANWQAQQGITGKIILLSVARLTLKNRFDLVIQALPQLIQQFPNLLWCVIGEGELRASLKTQAQQLGVANYIRWLGSIYHEDDLAPWFLSSKVLVHPGAIGLTLMHAFGYGVPVITHNNQSNQMPEFTALEHDVNGLLFDEGSVASLCEKIIAILNNETMCQRLGRNALTQVKTYFNVQVMVERFLSIVQLAVREKSNQLL